MPRTIPIAPDFFWWRTKKMHLCLATSRKNWINYFSFEFFWEETAKMVGYFFLGREDLTNSNYDVISIINQSCHLTICLADWVAISLTSDFLLKERVDHMKKWLSWENFYFRLTLWKYWKYLEIKLPITFTLGQKPTFYPEIT